MSADSFSLVGDIGGTNARFALVKKGSLKLLHPSQRKNAQFHTLQEAIEDYLANDADGIRPERACIAVASPITGDSVQLTNHSWRFSIEAMRAELKLEALHIINDFTAMAMAIPHLPEDDRIPVGGGEAATDAAIAVVGPGTGLGVSGLIPAPNGGYAAIAGEGGHVGVAPSTPLEAQVLAYTQQEFPRVSAERLLCGAGISILYRALNHIGDHGAEPLREADITQRAVNQRDPLCIATLELFSGMLGSFAGDLALTLGARGGVYITGGIIPRFADIFQSSPFRERFEDKGRFRSYNAAIPAFIVNPQDNPALLGCASHLLQTPEDSLL